MPDHRLLPIERAAREDYLLERNADSPLFRYALAPYLVAWSASTAIGLAREAMDVFVEPGVAAGHHLHDVRASERRADRSSTARRGRAEVEAATLLRDKVSALVMEKAERGEQWTVRERIDVRAGTAYAVRLAKEAVQNPLDGKSGATSLREDAPMQRLARDAQAISLHSLLLPSTNV